MTARFLTVTCIQYTVALSRVYPVPQNALLSSPPEGRRKGVRNRGRQQRNASVDKSVGSGSGMDDDVESSVDRPVRRGKAVRIYL